MGLISRYYTFVDGETDAGKITAARLNGNLDNAYNEINGNLDEDNIKDSCNIPKINADYTISGDWTFSGATVLSGSVTFSGSYIKANSLVFINDTANAQMTQGLTINQGANDDEIIALKSSDVAHGITTWTEGKTETDTFAYFKKLSATEGGLHIGSFTESTAGISFEVYAIYGAASTAKNSTASGAINLAGLKADPTNGTYKKCAANENIFTIKTKPEATDTYQAIFIVDEDGDILYDGSAAAFQGHDDIKLVKEVENALSDTDDYNKIIKHEAVKHGIVKPRKREDKQGTETFISTKRLNMLFLGAIRQLEERIIKLENKK